MRDDNVAFAISPLIRYEVLRGIHWQDNASLAQLSGILGQFEEFDINREISELSANLFRYDIFQNSSARNIEKRKFDVFHFSTAKCCQLEIHSEDSDISKLESLYSKYSNECQTFKNSGRA